MSGTVLLRTGSFAKPAWLCHNCWRSLAASGKLLCFSSPPYAGSALGGTGTARRTSSCASLTVDVENGPITFSTGKYAHLADGAVLVQSGNTSVVVTAVSDRKRKSTYDGTPLLVDYRERAAAAGRIPQNFLRRELNATNNETLVSRFIDRSIRPFFPAGYAHDTQVICNLLAVDVKHDPEILSINGAAAALMLSDIPWNGPVAAVRVGLLGDELCVNSGRKELEFSKLNLIVASTKDRIVMVEGSAHEVSEEKLCEAVRLGFKEAQPLLEVLTQLGHHRRKPIRETTPILPSPQLRENVAKLCREQVSAILADPTHDKTSRDEALFAVLETVKEQYKENSTEAHLLSQTFWDVCRDCMRDNMLDRHIRCDGRGVRDLRSIQSEVDIFEPLHGSAIFKRGETQVFCTVTFDSPESAVKTDLISMILGAQRSKGFMVHYEFPPFATNVIGRFLFPGRREIGHGSLAEKALLPLLPEEFPFTIRLNSQVLDSNGSSSMASVCGGSLALFDAGVPMTRAAAGVACGLFARTSPGSDEIEKYQVLTDIVGIEDAVGNMDFKMAGTREGVTSIQLDVKGLLGIPYHIFEETVMQSRDGRYQVLDIMDQCQSSPRPQLKENGPAYATIEIPIGKRMKLLGAGGHRIRALIAETGATIRTISDDHISIFAPTREAMDDVTERVEAIFTKEEFDIGEIIPATIKEVREYGVIVELAPEVTVLLHISEISQEHIKHPSDLGLRVGQVISVKYFGRNATGRHQVSHKALLPALSSPLQSQENSSLHTIDQDSLPAEEAKTQPLFPKVKKEFDIGAIVPATIKEVRNYGVMVELAPGVTTLLHNSEMSQGYIRHPSDLGLGVGQVISVKNLGKDPVTGRHQVSHKALLPAPSSPLQSQENSSLHTLEQDNLPAEEAKTQPLFPKVKKEFDIGAIVPATIKEVRSYGVMVELAPGVTTLLHNSEMSQGYIRHPSDLGLGVGQVISVKNLGKDPVTGRLQVSHKALLPAPSSPLQSQENSSLHTLEQDILPAEEAKTQPLFPKLKKEFDNGAIIPATIKEVRSYGVMVELAPGVATLLHNSDMSQGYIRHPLDLGLGVGQGIRVKYFGKDPVTGRHRISHKALLPAPSSFQGFDNGAVIPATVKEVRSYGVMVELIPGVTTLLHNSDLSHADIRHPSDLGLGVGQVISVKYFGKDPITGRHWISHKALLPVEEPKSQFNIGAILLTTVRKVLQCGVMVELAPGVTALLHNSQMSHGYIRHPSDLGLGVGQGISVKYFGKDPVTGRHRISHKALLPAPSSFQQFNIGAILLTTVRKVLQCGVVVELAPGVTALLHNSQMSQGYIRHPSDLGLGVGQVISVKYFGKDPITGRHRISHKALLPAPSSSPELGSLRPESLPPHSSEPLRSCPCSRIDLQNDQDL